MNLLDLARIDAHARALAALAGEVVEVPGFTLFLGGDGDAFAIPGALPDDADGLEAAVAGLLDAFAHRGVAPRVELSLLASRALPAALATRGLAAVDEAPLFVCRPAGLRPRRGEARVRWIGAGDDLAFVASVMRQGFEVRGPAGDAGAALGAALAGPLRLAFAELRGAPAGTGCSTPLAGVTEISSLSTLPNVRRRGVGAQTATFLLEEHFGAGGDLAWACAPDTRAAALLLDVGFEDAGLRVAFGEAPR
jgi:GNAT superfamily N-acetyltransferase